VLVSVAVGVGVSVNVGSSVEVGVLVSVSVEVAVSVNVGNGVSVGVSTGVNVSVEGMLVAVSAVVGEAEGGGIHGIGAQAGEIRVTTISKDRAPIFIF